MYVGFALALLGRHVEVQDCFLRSPARTLRRLAHSCRQTGRPAEARSAEREAAEALRLTGRLGSDPRRGETTVDRVICDTFRAAVGIIAS